MTDIPITLAHIASIKHKLDQLTLTREEAAILAAVLKVAADAIGGGAKTVHWDVLEEDGPAGELNPSAVRYPGDDLEVSIGAEFAAAFEPGSSDTGRQHKVVNHRPQGQHPKVTDPARR